MGEFITSFLSTVGQYEELDMERWFEQTGYDLSRLPQTTRALITTKLLPYVHERCCTEFTTQLSRFSFFATCDVSLENDRQDDGDAALEALFTRARNHAHHWIQHTVPGNGAAWLPLFESLYQRCVTDKLENLA